MISNSNEDELTGIVYEVSKDYATISHKSL